MKLYLNTFLILLMVSVSAFAQQKKDTIVIVGNAACAPYEFIDENGKPTGFDVELLEALMKKMKQPYQLKLLPWAKCVKALERNEVDLVIGMRKTAAREKKFKFGPTTSYDYEAIVCRKDYNPVVRIEDLRNEKVAVEASSYSEDMLVQMVPPIKHISVRGNNDVLMSVHNKVADVGILTRGVAAYVIKTHKIDNLRITGTLQTPIEYHISGHDQQLIDKVSYSLYLLKMDGTYEELYDKWLADKSQDVTKYIYLGLLLLFAAIAIGITFNVMLRKKVRKAEWKLSRNERELRKSQDRLNYVLTSSNFFTWIFDCHEHTMTTYRNGNQIVRKMTIQEYLNLLADNDNNEMQTIVEQMIRGEIKEFSTLSKWKPESPDGHPQYYEVNGIQVLAEDGNVECYFGLRRNVTKDIENEEILREERNKAIEAEHLESVFLANMSHEIRTPLNSIMGFSDLMLYDEDKNDLKEYRSIMKSNCDLLMQLINDILDLSKIEAGVVKLRPEKFDMTLLVNEDFANFKLKNDNPDLQIRCECPYECCIVELDRNRTSQIINNFATNAMKYTSKGHITIGYKAEDGGVKVYVEDTGKGIDEKNGHGRVFQRFEKLDSLVQGIGLGLSICRDIVKMCDGKIDYVTQLGKGTTFWAWFPCKTEIS